MSNYDPALVAAIKTQSPSTGYEEALLLGGFYETGIGTNPASYSKQGVPDPTWSSPSFGPFMWHYNTGALNDLMNQYGWTEQQAIDYVTTPSGAVSAALTRYENVATAQGINPNSSPLAAMELASAAEVGTGEQNALSSGSWQGVYNSEIQPLLGKAGNQPVTPTNQSTTNPNPPTSGQRETNAGAVAVAKSNLASLSPQKTRNPDPNNPRGFVYTMNQYMNPQFETTATDAQGNKRTFWSGVEDAITGKAELQILGDITGTSGTVGTIVHDAEMVTNPTNVLLGVRQWITRLSVFAIGAVIVFIAVNALTKGSLMNMFSKVPVIV